MSIYKCPKGHKSTESDYCSECGAKIQGSPELVAGASDTERYATNPLTATVPQTTRAVVNCPDCTAPHEPDSGNFCEICGYNFVTGAHGEIPLLTIAPGSETTTPATNNGADVEVVTPDFSVSSSAPTKVDAKTVVPLEVVVTVDASLREPESPAAPTHQPPITFQLDKEISLIGRRSDRRGIYPDISLDSDDAVSHRHALLVRQPEGTFILRDIGSANGTLLNGVELAAMVDTPIKAGDEFTLGHWTRIIVRAATL